MQYLTQNINVWTIIYKCSALWEYKAIKSSFHTQGAFNPWVEIKISSSDEIETRWYYVGTVTQQQNYHLEWTFSMRSWTV